MNLSRSACCSNLRFTRISLHVLVRARTLDMLADEGAGCARLRAAARWPLTRPSFDGLRAFRDLVHGTGRRTAFCRSEQRTADHVPLRAARCGGANAGVFAGADSGAFPGPRTTFLLAAGHARARAHAREKTRTWQNFCSNSTKYRDTMP